jgi:hypothetical protein
MSAVLVFVAVAFVLSIAVYCGVGTYVRYRGGVRGCPDVVPHLRFWRNAALLAWDGLRFCFTCGRSRATSERPSFDVPEFASVWGGVGSGRGRFSVLDSEPAERRPVTSAELTAQDLDMLDAENTTLEMDAVAPAIHHATDGELEGQAEDDAYA